MSFALLREKIVDTSDEKLILIMHLQVVFLSLPMIIGGSPCYDHDSSQPMNCCLVIFASDRRSILNRSPSGTFSAWID